MGYSEIFNIPNSIDFVRILLLLASVFYENLVFSLFYCSSVGLDYFDGKAARYFSQTTVLGGCLDMVIDRVSTMVICFKIARTKENHQKKCLIYIIIDFISHFIYFIAMIYLGSHHKKYANNLFLSIYYNKIPLSILCFGSEACFITTYLFKKESFAIKALQLIALVKTFFHVVHFCVGTWILS